MELNKLENPVTSAVSKQVALENVPPCLPSEGKYVILKIRIYP